MSSQLAICGHGRLLEHCEDCALVVSMERGHERPEPERTDPPPAPEVAGEDLLIDRPDLGPGSYTLVQAGDPIPRGLTALPRSPRTPTAEPKARRRR